MAIVLAVRRFFCAAPGCPGKTFAEQVDGLTTRYARKTPLLAAMLGSIAVALAGRAGSRLASSLGVPASRQVLLRLVMAAPDPQAASPRVLGVDDFATRRGQHYGTLLTGIEAGAPLDLLEGRDARPLADWLAAHPGVEVICRDRSGSYADGARTGAPDAVQVADRFHRWQNLAKAAGKCVASHRACLAEPAPPPAAGDEAPALPEPEGAGQPDPADKYAGRTRRHHALVHELRAEGRCGILSWFVPPALAGEVAREAPAERDAALRPGALVIADDIDQEDLQPYLDYVRAPDSGYENVTFPDGDEGMETSCRT